MGFLDIIFITLNYNSYNEQHMRTQTNEINCVAVIVQKKPKKGFKDSRKSSTDDVVQERLSNKTLVLKLNIKTSIMES